MHVAREIGSRLAMGAQLAGQSFAGMGAILRRRDNRFRRSRSLWRNDARNALL
jgi:hypothetical protein